MQWLSSSGLFRRVRSKSAYILPTHVLEGTVQAIYGDYGSALPRAVLQIELALVKDPGWRAQVVFEKIYSREIPAPGGKPPDLVRAWNRAFSEILTAFESDLGTEVSFK
jgi:cholesterol transport system auxiliary component